MSEEEMEYCDYDDNELYMKKVEQYLHYELDDNNEWDSLGDWSDEADCKNLCEDCYNKAKKTLEEFCKENKANLKKETEESKENKKCIKCGTSKNLHQIEKYIVLFDSEGGIEENYLMFIRVICSDCWAKNVYPDISKELYKYVGW